MDGISLTKLNDREADSTEQDKTASTCMMILLYSLSEINPSPLMADKVLKESLVIKTVRFQLICTPRNEAPETLTLEESHL